MTVSFDRFGLGFDAVEYVQSEVDGQHNTSTAGGLARKQHEFEFPANESAANGGSRKIQVQCHVDHGLESDFSTDDTESESKSSNSSRSPSCDDDSIQDENFTDLSFSSDEVTDLLLNLKEVVIPTRPNCAVLPNTTSEQANQKRSDTTSLDKERSYLALRVTYLLVTLVIMLADGLQGK